MFTVQAAGFETNVKTKCELGFIWTPQINKIFKSQSGQNINWVMDR